jgi:uncharacterized protein YndB with AHSA1/START domain
MPSDRIEKKTLLHAPLARVWKALTDAHEFGAWFGVALDEPFVEGKTVRGTIAATTVDPDVAELQKPFVGLPFEILIEELVPERRFAFRWHPFAIERDVDYSSEPTTLVVFTLDETAEGVWLTLTESGFEHVPLARRARAFTANEGGWEKQLELVGRYLARGA